MTENQNLNDETQKKDLHQITEEFNAKAKKEGRYLETNPLGFLHVIFQKNQPKNLSLGKLQTKKLSLIKILILVTFMFYVLAITENYWLVIILSLITLLFINKNKIILEIGEAMKIEGNHSQVITEVVLRTIFMNIFIYVLGTSLLLILITPLVCDFQNSINVKLFSKKFCEKSITNLLISFENSKY